MNAFLKRIIQNERRMIARKQAKASLVQHKVLTSDPVQALGAGPKERLIQVTTETHYLRGYHDALQDVLEWSKLRNCINGNDARK